jgi:Peptide N-acetyl-beta-D-glucosaminyl asparaginase amidase A
LLGPYREVLAYFDERLVGTTVPHPVVFTGGIVPSLWRPTVSIGGAFNIPSTWIDVSPFVGLMVDGKQHTIKFQVRMPYV